MTKINKQFGYSLIELMITITLGSFLILGAAYAFQEARKTYTTNDNVARLYEQAQYSLSVIEEDIRLSNFWGLHNQRSAVYGDSNDTTNPVAAGLQNISGDCSNTGWALDLRLGISGSDQVAPPWATAGGCAADFRNNTDTLVTRHADYNPVITANLDNGQVYIRSNESPLSRIFLGNNGEPNVSITAQNFEFVTNAYFVANNSATGGDAIPTLMREALIDNGNQPAIETQEVIRGVEDFQVQFGLDYDVTGNPSYGVIDRYVNPDSPAINDATSRVLAVRFWILLRAPEEENGYTNESTYNYANVANYQPNDGFRRLLVSRTVQIRNITF